MRQTAFMALMRVLPKSALSHAVGALTQAPAPRAAHEAAIRAFATAYGVNVDEAELPPGAYATFGAFFCRKLKEGARPIDDRPEVVVSPVDGAVSQVGEVQRGRCIQAKGIDFPLAALLGSDAEAQALEGGPFATLYLSPKDYHRIHSPGALRITGMRYLPGALWPVNAASVSSVEALFAVNERVVLSFESPRGRGALVAVGATCVGRIRLSIDALVSHSGQPATARSYSPPIGVSPGQELGMFEMGSTVILVFEKGTLSFSPELREGTAVRMGRALGAWL